jgi:hypothetical protein
MSKSRGVGRGLPGRLWWHTLEGKDYRAVEPRSIDDVRGRANTENLGKKLAGRYWWHTPDGQNYLAHEAKNSEDTKGIFDSVNYKRAAIARKEQRAIERLSHTKSDDTSLSEERIYYNYVYFTLDGIPRWVGKGKNKRYKAHERNSHNLILANLMRKAGGDLPVVVIREGLTEAEAFETEVALIAAIGRADLGLGPLVNHDNGGRGATYLSPEVREARAAKLRGRKHPPRTQEARDRMSISAKIRPPITEETRRRHSEAQRGRPPRSKETCDKLSSSIKAYWDSLSDKERVTRRTNISSGTKAGMEKSGASDKISSALSGRTHNAARRQITSESLKRKYEEDPDFHRRIAERLKDSLRFSGHQHSEETKRQMRKSHADRNRDRREEQRIYEFLGCLSFPSYEEGSRV